MALNYYQAGSAFGAGLVSQVAKDYAVKKNMPHLDLVTAAGLLGVGYMLSDSPNTTQRSVGIGIFDGAAGYLGAVVQTMLKIGPAYGPVQVRLPEPAAVRPLGTAGSRISVLEI